MHYLGGRATCNNIQVSKNDINEVLPKLAVLASKLDGFYIATVHFV